MSKKAGFVRLKKERKTLKAKQRAKIELFWDWQIKVFYF